jgi:hypothetical protein
MFRSIGGEMQQMLDQHINEILCDDLCRRIEGELTTFLDSISMEIAGRAWLLPDPFRVKVNHEKHRVDVDFSDATKELLNVMQEALDWSEHTGLSTSYYPGLCGRSWSDYVKDITSASTPEEPTIADTTIEAAVEPLKRHICAFVLASDLVPVGWTSWFWACVSDGAPFDWGNNNRSLVTASRFEEHCDACLIMATEDHGVPQEDIDAFLRLLDSLGETYVDLEN